MAPTAWDFFAELDRENFWDGHVLDPGNTYDQVGYFVAFPAWWRRFAFRILSPRDLAVYIYICSYMSTQRSARPTQETIANDLGSNNRHGASESLKRLVELGFLLRQKMPSLAMSRNRHPRYVYQRPCIEFTLATLLSKGYLNGFMQPTSSTLRRGQQKFPGNVEPRIGKQLVEPLKALLGDEGFAEYARLRNEPKMRQYLIAQFEFVVEARRNQAKAAAQAR